MFLLSVILAAVVFDVVNSGMCGCMPQACQPCMPPPPPMCPPMLPPLPCPQAPPCFCPPQPICPPPMPPPVCPPPMPQPSCQPCGGYQLALPMPQPQYVMTPPQNDCCCNCQSSSCRFRGRARTHGSRIFSALTTVEEDPTCNSEKLRAIIEENITDDPTISKRAIQAAAEEKLFAKINVICGREDFSYLVYTESYCQATVGELTCYAFRASNAVGTEQI